MARQRERFFLVYAMAVSLLTLGLTLLYPPATGAPQHRYAFIVILVVVALARIAGTVAGVVSACLASATIVLLPLAGMSPGELGIDATLDFLALLTVTVGLALYVGTMRQRELEASAHEQEAAIVARLSLDLLPPSLAPDDIARLADRVASIVGGDEVRFLVPDAAGALAPWLECDANAGSLAEGTRRTAQFVFDSQRSLEPAALEPEQTANHLSAGRVRHGLITSRDAYVPLRSGSGVEGMLIVHRQGDPATRWGQREEAFLGFVASLVGTLIDRDRLQAQASSALALEEADRLKANIISSVSHDLKTPLAAVVATVTGLLSGEDPDVTVADVRDDLLSMEGDLGALGRRIGELIDVSRLETASWKPNLEWNDVDDLCRLARGQLGAERARVACKTPAEPLVGRFDLAQMARALYHLIENALAYSPADSEVIVSAAIDGALLRIWVEDRGPGVPAEERDAIFEKFRRGSAGLALPGGTGLGLSVVSGIVAAHGGTVEIEHVDPCGSRFSIVIPVESEVVA
jgi:two-component system sensor histidine kinase KdpD